MDLYVFDARSGFVWVFSLVVSNSLNVTDLQTKYIKTKYVIKCILIVKHAWKEDGKTLLLSLKSVSCAHTLVTQTEIRNASGCFVYCEKSVAAEARGSLKPPEPS